MVRQREHPAGTAGGGEEGRLGTPAGTKPEVEGIGVIGVAWLAPCVMCAVSAFASPTVGHTWAVACMRVGSRLHVQIRSPEVLRRPAGLHVRVRV